MKYNLHLSLLLALLFSLTTGAQHFSIKKTPSWVKDIEVPKEPSISKYDVTSGYYFTLSDYQINLEENTTFYREVSNVLSYSGITNASQLNIVYDTSYQKVAIHHLIIWRKGKKIDRTKELSIEILNNEDQLDQGIYSGKITAYDNLDDIRKDDLIDFAYSIIGTNPIFGEGKYIFYPLEAMNPIDLYSLRVIYPKEEKYIYECKDCDSTIHIIDEEIDDYHQIHITNLNLKPLKLDDNIPSWILPFKYFTLSSYSSWIDVNKWAQEVFTLSKKQNFETVFEEIFTGKENIDEKINKIINYVQDDIRYMGIESGIGSIKPFPPEQVVKQRFGDCKDKSLLLVSLLKQIGVENAYPVLVNTMISHSLNQYQPSSEVFNHCIIMYEYDDSTYWLDPTISQQGGDYRKIAAPNYGKALVVGLPSDSLLSMPSISSGSATFVVEEMTMTSFSEPAVLKIQSTRTGFEADRRRSMMEYYQSEDLSKGVTDDLKLYFPTVEKTGDLKVTDDIEKNIFIVEYDYEVDGFWQDGNKSSNFAHYGYWLYRFEPQSLYYYLSKSVCEERTYDVEISYPMEYNYRVILHFPNDLLVSDEIKPTENEAFYLEEIVEQLDENTVMIDYKLRIKAKEIKVESYMDICEEINELVDELPFVIYFPKK